MFDLEILVPAEAELKDRFNDFKKWGIQNVGNYKIKLVLATSVGNDLSIFKDGWPNGVEIKILETPYKHVAQRIYHYYDTMLPNTAKWYCRIDEDSMNDIGGLMENLNESFDYERDYHIVSEVHWDLQPVEQETLKEIGLEDWLKKNKIPHEHEISITSNAAMNRIISHEKAREYFAKRKQKASGYGDHGLAFCARMVKIHPTIVKFLKIHPEINNFSIYGGECNHIHEIARDRTPNILNWLDSIDENKTKLYEGKSFLLEENNEKKWIKLSINHRIDDISFLGRKQYYAMWCINKEDKLVIYRSDWKKNSLLIFETNNAPDSNEIITYTNATQPNIKLKTGPLSAITALSLN